MSLSLAFKSTFCLNVLDRSIHNPSVELSAAPLNEVAALEPAAAEDAAEQATQLKLTQALA